MYDFDTTLRKGANVSSLLGVIIACAYSCILIFNRHPWNFDTLFKVLSPIIVHAILFLILFFAGLRRGIKPSMLYADRRIILLLCLLLLGLNLYGFFNFGATK